MAATDTKPAAPDILDPWDEMTRAKQRNTGRRKSKAAAGILAGVVLAGGLTTGITAAALNSARNDAAASLSRAAELYTQRQDTTVQLVELLLKSEPLERDTIDPAIDAANMSAVNTPDAGGTGKRFERYVTAQADMETSLRRLKYTTDRHRDLQANKVFTAAMRQAQAPEITAAQDAYNQAAARYNGIREGFPGIILAPLLGHGAPWGTFRAP